MILLICGVATLALGVTLWTTLHLARSLATEEAVSLAEEAAFHYGSQVERNFEYALQKAATVAQVFEGAQMGDSSPSRSSFSRILKQVLITSPTLHSIWTGWEPDAMDGHDAVHAGTEGHDATGRFVWCWYRGEGGKISARPLVDYDKAGAGDYYLNTVSTGKVTMTESVDYMMGGGKALMTRLVAPISLQGKVIGVVGVDMSLARVGAALKEFTVFGDGIISLVNQSGEYVAHPNEAFVGKPATQSTPWVGPYLGNIRNGEAFTLENESRTLGCRVLRMGVPVTIGETGTSWSVIVSIPKGAILVKVRRMMLVGIAIAMAAIALFWVIIYWLTGSITGPILADVEAAEQMAAGDLTVQISCQRTDELGVLSDALNRMARGLGTMVGEIREGVKLLGGSATNLLSVSEDMATTSSAVSSTSGEAARAAGDAENGMITIAAAMEQASVNSGMVAAAAEEMNATIGEIAGNTERAHLITDNAVSLAETASGRIDELGKAVQEIGAVTEAITEISEQTNLLALNATIEAARAGEYGKGFAVVASEIKALAMQTSDATQNIRTRITGIQASSDDAVTAVDEIRGVIREVAGIVSGIASAVEEQSSTTREIAGNISQAAEGLSEISHGVKTNSQLTEKINGDIQAVNRHAEHNAKNGTTVKFHASSLEELSRNIDTLVSRFHV